MIAPIFVDTNVLLYARDASEKVKQPIAAQWLARLWEDHSGRTSIQVLSEYYVNVTRKLHPGLSADDAWDDVRALLSWRPQPVDRAVLEAGHEIRARFRLGWWDSLVVAAAQLQGCIALLSEDLQDGMAFGPVTVRNPFVLKAREVDAIYAAAPARRSAHPPRGRPRV